MGTAFRGMLTVLRFVLPAWIGAATLFAINASAEQRHPFDSGTKNQLALLRFPDYYRFGFISVISAILITGVLVCFPTKMRQRLVIALVVLTATIALMLWDFHFIYGPLHEMILDPTQPKPSTWVRLHATSMIINLVHVSLCLVASIVVCWPLSDLRTAEASSTPLPPT